MKCNSFSSSQLTLPPATLPTYSDRRYLRFSFIVDIARFTNLYVIITYSNNNRPTDFIWICCNKFTFVSSSCNHSTYSLWWLTTGAAAGRIRSVTVLIDVMRINPDHKRLQLLQLHFCPLVVSGTHTHEHFAIDVSNACIVVIHR